MAVDAEALAVIVEARPPEPGGGIALEKLLVEGDVVEAADRGEPAGAGRGNGSRGLLPMHSELNVLAAHLERPELAGC